MSFAQLTLTSPFLAGESHCIRIAPGHNWPLWELSPRMSLWPPELEYACGITLGISYDSRTFSREKGAPGTCGESVPQRGADGVVRKWADWLPHRKGGTATRTRVLRALLQAHPGAPVGGENADDDMSERTDCRYSVS